MQVCDTPVCEEPELQVLLIVAHQKQILNIFKSNMTKIYCY